MTEHSQSYPDTPDAFHPDKNLPDCMMPDGGECCAGHAALVEDWHKQRREIERLRGVAQRPTGPRAAERLADVVMMLDTPDAYNREYIAAVCRSILSSLSSTNHQSLDQLLDGMTDENRYEELPVSPICTEGK